MGGILGGGGGGIGKALKETGENYFGPGTGGAVRSISNAITGTSKDAGVLGVGQYKASPVDIDASAFGDKESEALQKSLKSQMKSAMGTQAPTMDAAQIGKMREINHANIGPAAQMNAAQIGAMQNAQAATIDQGQQAQFRNQQNTLAQQLAAQAAGQGPSLAQSQLQQATNRNIAQAMALAGSQRGLSAGQGMRQIAQSTAAANQQAAQQSADLRMQEQMAARGQLAGVLGQGREQDIGLAQSQAALQQQAALSNQAAQNQATLSQAQLQQQAGLANQGALNDNALAQAQLNQQASALNQAAVNQSTLQQASLNQQANAANQQATLQQTGLNNEQQRFFNQGIMGLTQGDRDAAMALETLKVNQNVNLAAANQQGYAAASKARGDLLGNIGAGVAAFMADGGVVPDVGASDYAKKFAEGWRSGQPDESGHARLGKALGTIAMRLGQGGPDASASGGNIVQAMSEGGTVPGSARTGGDSYANDTVQTRLSPGEIVVPRTIAQDEAKTVAFIKAIRAQHEAENMPPMHERLASIEQKLSQVLKKRRA